LRCQHLRLRRARTSQQPAASSYDPIASKQ
jgi:hypothetical protein